MGLWDNYSTWLATRIIADFGRSKVCNPDNADTAMELPPSPSSLQFNVRRSGEPGVAEWAQKIRALQRQVDEDEEEEHRKLEQEIAASRLARVRRSHGAVNGRTSLDPAAGMPSSLIAGQHDDPGDVCTLHL
jgi:hypothetical protein